MAETTAFLFQPGAIVCTPGALRALMKTQSSGPDLVLRHLRGDFGALCAEDTALNQLAIATGGRVLSSYELPDQTKVWVITEADRSVTTLLLPDEY